MAKMIYGPTLQEWLRLCKEKGAAVDTTNPGLGREVRSRKGRGTGPDQGAGCQGLMAGAIPNGLRVPDAVVAQVPPFAARLARQATDAPLLKAAYAALGPNLDTSLVATRGFSIRMADGTPVRPEFRDEVGAAMGAIEAALGIDGGIWRKAGLTIVRIGGSLPGAPPASGCFVPEEMTITLENPPEYEEEAPLQSLAHEVVHLLDCRKPGRHGHTVPGRYHSKACADAVDEGGDARRETALCRRALRSMTRTGFRCPDCRVGGAAPGAAECRHLRDLRAHDESPNEVFARLGEQYVAQRAPGAPAATLPIELYRASPLYWRQKAFAELEQEVGEALRRRRDHWTARTWPVH